MKKKPEDPARVAYETLKDLNASLRINIKRKALWDKAAEKHLKLPPDGVMDLAIRFQNWRDLESRYPNWREKLWRGPNQGSPERVEKVIERLEAEGLSWLDIKECLQFQDRMDDAAAFDERKRKAELGNDHVFLSQWAEAGKMLEGGFSIKTKAAGLVLLAWRELGGLALFHKSPTQGMIKEWIEDRLKKRGLPKFSLRTWQRTWADPQIKALLLS